MGISLLYRRYAHLYSWYICCDREEVVQAIIRQFKEKYKVSKLRMWLAL